MFTSPTDYFERMRRANQSSASSNIRPLESLGDQAYWQGGTDRLHLLSGDFYFVLSIKDMQKISSDKGRDDLNAKISAHRQEKCQETARHHLISKFK
jgi:hypothetical protein